jgi:hypothetical protein
MTTNDAKQMTTNDLQKNYIFSDILIYYLNCAPNSRS